MTEISLNSYRVKIALTRDMLGTNPIGLDVMDRHILDRQRKLIAEKSKINKALNKYLDAKQISEEKVTLELAGLRAKIDEVIGTPLTDIEFESLKAGEFKKFSDLRESMKELDNKGITCFLRNPASISEPEIQIGSHMILGFLKAAADAITRTNTKKNGTILRSSTFTTSILNTHLAIFPDMITASKDIKRDAEGKPEYLQRSLRAMTAQGPRVSLAKSEVLPTDTCFEFTLEVLDGSPLKEEHLKEMLSYGKLHGLGQWRNAGYGRFKVIEFSKE